MITLIFGSRGFASQGKAEYQMLELLTAYCNMGRLKEGPNFIIVTGGARGTDTIAMRASRNVLGSVAVVKPNYKKYKHYATHRRNDFMIANANRAIGFWHGGYVKSGTASVILKCLIKKIPLVINRWDTDNDEFVEVEPEVFIVNAPLDWIKSWTSLKWLKENYPSYVFPKEVK